MCYTAFELYANMKIAILGGSFDPPHLGHLLIAQQVIESVGVNQVWLMPNYDTSTHHEIFQKKLSSPEDRLAMVKLLERETIKAHFTGLPEVIN